MVLCGGECAEGRQTVERLNNKYHQNHFPYSHHWWKSTFYSWGVGITGIFLFWPLFMCYCGVTKAILFITKRLIPTSDARQECGKFSDDRREKKEKMVLSKKIRTYVSDCTTELACSRMCYSSTCVRHVVIHTCRRTTVLLKKNAARRRIRSSRLNSGRTEVMIFSLLCWNVLIPLFTFWHLFSNWRSFTQKRCCWWIHSL